MPHVSQERFEDLREELSNGFHANLTMLSPQRSNFTLPAGDPHGKILNEPQRMPHAKDVERTAEFQPLGLLGQPETER